MSLETNPESHDDLVPLGRLRLDVERFIYGMVSVLSVLAVYQGSGTGQGDVGFVAVVLGPTIALFLAHLFATATSEHFQLRRKLTFGEWIHLTRRELQFFLVPIPLCVAFALSRLVGADVGTALRTTMFVGIASLAILVAYAAWLAGVRRWPLVLAGLGGLVIGATILAIELALTH